MSADMTRLSRLFIIAVSVALGMHRLHERTGAGVGARTGRRRRPPRPTRTRSGRCRTRTTSATRYSGLSEINTENVKNLKVAWTFSTGVLRGHEGEPLVVGNTMYVHTPFPNIVYALDLSKEGAPIKWKYTPKQDPAVIPIACCDTVNRGVTYDDGKIFFNQLDTNTVALDAETGKELWKVKQGDYKQGQTDHRRRRW